ncbi:MAG: type II toxin-antitoxin system VapB family antitoxin [Mycobacterium sp.]
MHKTEMIRVNEDLIRETVRRYRLASDLEAVHLALRTLLGDEEYIPADQEYDEFGDMRALQPHRNSDGG